MFFKKGSMRDRELLEDNAAITISVPTAGSGMRNIFCGLSRETRDDIIQTLEVMINAATRVHCESIVFVPFYTKRGMTDTYRSFLKKKGETADTSKTRMEYIFSTPDDILAQEWEDAQRDSTDISCAICFVPDLGDDTEKDDQVTREFRLTPEASAAITRIMEASFGHGNVYVSREVLHCGVYLNEVDSIYSIGADVLNGEPRAHKGMYLQQHFGYTADDGRRTASVCCVPMVVRVPMQREMSLKTARDIMRCFSGDMPEKHEIYSQLEQSGVPVKAFVNRLALPSVVSELQTDMLVRHSVIHDG